MRILAVIAARNEQFHISRALQHFTDQGIDVILIDNQSTDDTVAIAERFKKRGLLEIVELPWTGSFSLTDQLALKAQIVAAAEHDWIVHADADEWLCPPDDVHSLADAISQVDRAGYNCINFHELVFVPMAGEDYAGTEYHTRMLDYYFFQPRYPRLNRAWKRRANLSHTGSGGHVLVGDELKRWPVDFYLRHYIALSEQYAYEKYILRRFSDGDLTKGWHGNRINISPERLMVQKTPCIKRLETWNSVNFDLSEPQKKHFWQW